MAEFLEIGFENGPLLTYFFFFALPDAFNLLAEKLICLPPHLSLELQLITIFFFEMQVIMIFARYQ